MKKQTIYKLTINKNTIANLQKDELYKAHGGAATISCGTACPTNLCDTDKTGYTCFCNTGIVYCE